ncbi:MAG: ComF family protein [Terrimicrobiaceae bacterium]|nr:ComF family protein [Terrimicrobiaceae bacterium]
MSDQKKHRHTSRKSHGCFGETDRPSGARDNSPGCRGHGETALLAALLDPLRSLFFPSHCAGCACAVPEGTNLCGACDESIEKIRPPRCEVCSQPYSGNIPAFTCPNCRGDTFHFDCAIAVVRSRGVVREMVHRLKYGKELWLGRILAGWTSEGLEDQRLEGWTPDALVPVPLHPRRLREREFNQAEILCQELSRISGIQVFSPLARRRYTTTQTRLDRKGRRQNLRDAFILRKNGNVMNMNLLLVDDVLTTGSTLDACAAVLLEAGARSVRALTAARG